MQLYSIIQISRNIELSKVLFLINRLIGASFVQINENHMIYSSKIDSCNFQSPSSYGNPWFLDLLNHLVFYSKENSHSYQTFSFLDPFQQKKQIASIEKHYLYYEFDVPLNPIWYKIGQKIVDCFGGKMIYNQLISEQNEHNIYIKNHLHMTDFKSTSGFYQFQNILWETKPLDESIFIEFEKKFFYYF